MLLTNGVVTDTANIIGDNSYHVISSTGVTSNTILDGIKITAGDANDITGPNNGGGGMENFAGSSPTLMNVTFSGNSSSMGGGIYNFDSSPTIRNTILWGNTATENGHQIYNFSGSPIISYSNPLGPDTGTYRIYRGGGWHSIYNYLRVFERHRNSPDYTNNGIGFRCAVSPNLWIKFLS